MSGIFGLVDSRQGATETILRQMATSLCLREWYNVRTWTAPGAGVGLGQVNIGIFSTEPQPAQNDDETITVFAFGEFYNADERRRALQAKGFQLRSNTDAELVLHLYEDHDMELVTVLEGAFVLAIWDARRRRLILANDHYGLLPLFYAHLDGRLLFAPQVKGILEDPAFQRRLNLTAVAEFLRFQRLLGTKTFFEGVQILSYGSLLVYDAETDTLSVTHYWDFDQTPEWPVGTPFNEAVQETGRLLRQSVQRRISGPYRIGVYLSGGLDSRTILGFARNMNVPVSSITYGLPDSRDAIYAQRLARRLGSDHHYFRQTDGLWVRDHADFHLEVTEGLTAYIHAHAAITLEPARQWIDVNLSGFYGDHLLGARAIQLGLTAANAPDDVAFLGHMFYILNQEFVWPGITEAEERLLYTDAFYPQVRDLAFESLRHELSAFAKFPPAKRLDYFATIYQGIRLSHLNDVYQHAFFEARYPFCDYALVEFVHSMPIEFRLGDRLYLAVINREIPQVTWVPRDSDNTLLTDQKPIRILHSLLQKTKHRINRHVLPIFPEWRTFHSAPEEWLRNDLHDWAANILLNPRTLERGILSPAFVRSIFDRHMSGHEIWTIGKIAPLITFEMMMRRYFDVAPATETEDSFNGN